MSNLNADMNQDMLSFRSSSLTMKGGSSLLEGRDSASAQPALSYSLGHVGAGSNAIALAAAQAVSNTLQVRHKAYPSTVLSFKILNNQSDFRRHGLTKKEKG